MTITQMVLLDLLTQDPREWGEVEVGYSAMEGNIPT